MLQQLLYFIIISSICIVWGLPVFAILKKKDEEKYWFGSGFPKLIFLFFSGLILLSVFSAWIILFLPLTFQSLLLFTLLPVLLYLTLFRSPFLQKTQPNKKKALHPLYIIFIVASLICFWILSSIPSVNPDTQLYHLQIIRWANEHGAVPGIVNIYPRLGLGSNWFNLISLFYIPSFHHQNFTHLNSTFVIWFFLWLFFKWHTHFKNYPGIAFSKTLSIFYFFLLIYFILDWQLLRESSNSTSYDLIVTGLTIFAISFLFEIILSEKKEGFLFFIFLCISIPSFKLSGVFILIFPLVILLFKKNFILTTITACILVLLPVFIKNYIITGYPLFPAVFSISSPDWQLPKPMAIEFRDYIMTVNKYYNVNLNEIATLNKTTFNWIPYWKRNILPHHQLLLALSFVSIILFFLPFQNKNYKKALRLVFVGLWILLASWFFTAPDPRFALGIITCMAFFPLAIFLKKIWPPVIYPISIFMIIAGLTYYSFRKSQPFFKNVRLLIYPSNILQPPYKQVYLNGTTFNYVEKINGNWNNRCFFTPLPCICEPNPFIYPRGNTLKEGFRMEGVPDINFVKKYIY